MRFAILLMLFMALVVVGETNDNASGTKSPTSTSASGNVIKFDDGVFDLQPKSKPPEVVKGRDGTERYVGPEADYNTEQRSEWIERCGPENSVSSKAFQECFDKERRRSKEIFRAKERDVESRQQKPLRNMNPLNRDARERGPDIDVETSYERD